MIDKNLIDNIHYIIFDPSKNITALVDTNLCVDSYELISKKIMQRENTVEQVGFLSYEDGCDIKLRMAGGEFCGNATMCAAAYVYLKQKKQNVKIKVHSIEDPINVNIKVINNNECEAEVLMPKAESIKNIKFKNSTTYPVVFFTSIAHIIVETDDISNVDKQKSELYIKNCCDELDIPAVGLIYYDKINSKIKPLVYVKNVDTIFWENACASGTTALGMYLYDKNKKDININVIQPSGAVLNVYNKHNNIYLNGNVKLISM